jgi:hypothetical protein
VDEQIIRSELKKHNYNVSKTARALGVDYVYLMHKIGPSPTSLASVTIPRGQYPEDISTLGKPGMERFVVAVKKVTHNWPVQFMNAIHDARRKYDNGTHEMCQETRADGWVIQYLVPRKNPDKNRRPYFFRRGV